jgi:hypothetical protein
VRSCEYTIAASDAVPSVANSILAGKSAYSRTSQVITLRAMRLHGCHADRLQIGDILVAMPFGHQLEDFALAF